MCQKRMTAFWHYFRIDMITSMHLTLALKNAPNGKQRVVIP